MSAAEYLRTLDWPMLQVLFGLGFDRQDVDETIEMAMERCEKASILLQTRCLFSTNLSAFLLNNVDEWRGTDLSTVTTKQGISSVKAINIEIDVTSRLDHMFILVNLGPTSESPSGWYIIQSYVNQYHTRVDPIDAFKLVNVIQNWRTHGVNPNEWKHYFHADIPSSNVAIPHVYITDRIFSQRLTQNVDSIFNRVRGLLNDEGSYLYDDKYRCLLIPYLQ